MKKPKFDSNPLCDLPGLGAVWQYVPPGSSRWLSTHFLLIFQDGRGELFDVERALQYIPTDGAEGRDRVTSVLFSACQKRDRDRIELLRRECTVAVRPSARLLEVIESTNTWECFDGGGIRGEPWFENDTQRQVAAEINGMIHREFFSGNLG